MSRHVILQGDRYGDGWKDAPSRVEIYGGDIRLAWHIAHTIQEWNWPGQEGMFYVEGDDWPGKCGCRLPARAPSGRRLTDRECFDRIGRAMRLPLVQGNPDDEP
jgi:hypothetical protein